MLFVSLIQKVSPFQKKNFNLLSGKCYFSRFIPGKDGEMLVTHQHETGLQVQPRPPSARTPGYAAGRSVNYIGTWKRARVDAEGTLRLFWWANNDGLKGEPISGPGDRDMQAGIWLERDLVFDSSSAANLSAATSGTPPPPPPVSEMQGITVGVKGGDATEMFRFDNVTILVDALGISRLGVLSADGKSFHALDTQNRELPPPAAGKPTTLKVLVRGNLIESYNDGVLMHVYSAGAVDGKAGWFKSEWAAAPTAAAADTSTIRAWMLDFVGSGAALGSKATATSTYSPAPDYDASLAVDDSPLTRWCSGLPYSDKPEQLRLDLGPKRRTIAWAQISWETAFATSYQLQASTDGKSWTTVYSTTEGEGGIETFSLNVPTTARYWTLHLLKRGCTHNCGYSIWDLQLHEATDTPACGYWEVC